MENKDSQSIGKDVPSVESDTANQQTTDVTRSKEAFPLSTRSASQITLVQEAPGADDKEKEAGDIEKNDDVFDKNEKETHEDTPEKTHDRSESPSTSEVTPGSNKELVSNETGQSDTVQLSNSSDNGEEIVDKNDGVSEVGTPGRRMSSPGDKDTNNSNVEDKGGSDKSQENSVDKNKMTDNGDSDKGLVKDEEKTESKSPTDEKSQKDEESDSVKDTDPLLTKTDSQKTLQSDTGSSVKSDSSSDAKKPEKKKHSYIPIVPSNRDKVVTLSDPIRKKNDVTAPAKPDPKREKDKSSRTGSVSSGQNIALKEKGDNSTPTETKGETTFSVVNEQEKNSRNVKWKENENANKDKKPTVNKHSKIPELDKKKQDVIQKSLQREKAILTNGDVKTPEKEKSKDVVKNSKTVVAVESDKKVPLDSAQVVEVKTEQKPKSILARAILKKVKEGSGQAQNDPKHLALNGQTPPVKATSRKSLTVPSPVPRDTTEDREDRLSIGSRRDSTKLSLSDSMSRRSVDYRVANATTVVIPGSGQEEEKPKAVVPNDSWIRSAIPYLPLPMAILCLFLNIFVPGAGTVLSGFAIFCCGRTRVQTKDDHVAITLCVNVWVGVAQLFTVTFLLVGWFWSMAWGIKMIILSMEYRKEQKQIREKELQALALNAFASSGNGRRGLFG